MMTNRIQRDQYIDIDDIRVRYRTIGTGKTKLLLIHGLGGSIEAWEENAAALSQECSVYAVDLPGHGKSDKPNVRYTLEYFTYFVKRFIRNLHISPCVIAGLSFGGAVVSNLTITHPDMVEKLILVSSVGLGTRMGVLFALGSMAPVRPLIAYIPQWVFAIYARSTVYDSRALPRQIIDFYFERLKTETFKRALLSMQRENFTFFGFGNKRIRTIATNIHLIKKKTLIIWGKNDTMVPLTNARRGHRCIRNSRLVVFDRCSHNPQFEKSGEFNRAVLEFLQMI
jgi:pimeloyl-ACP methyl ester carboxylesterase